MLSISDKIWSVANVDLMISYPCTIAKFTLSYARLCKPCNGYMMLWDPCTLLIFQSFLMFIWKGLFRQEKKCLIHTRLGLMEPIKTYSGILNFVSWWAMKGQRNTISLYVSTYFGQGRGCHLRTPDLIWPYQGGYCTLGPYFWRLCAFSQKIKQLWTKYPMDLVRNVPRNSKSQIYFSRDHCCEVTVKIVWKSIFSLFWTSINNHLS